MSIESKSPKEVLAFWRELKGTIREQCSPGEVFDIDDLVEYLTRNDIMTYFLEKAGADKGFQGEVAGASWFGDLAKAWALDNGYQESES